MSDSRRQAPAALIAALADRYRLRDELGRGGMATVYLADDLKYDRRVAIKVLRRELVGSEVEARRFLREIQISARLSHPNILPLLDSGTVSQDAAVDSTPFFVMPLVEGESLRARLTQDGALPVEESIRITSILALALDYSHRKNVVHRDIKPENVLFHSGQPVLTDFGIARAIRAASTESVTGRGLAIGTPHYMSPEQAAGDGAVDGRSDLYALACMAFEMLTGRPPFAGKTVRETLMRHLTEVAPRPRAFRSAVSPAVEDALLRAMAKEPDDRFQSLQEFAEALQSGLQRPVPASRPVKPDPLAIAVLPFVNATSDPDNDYFSDGITDELLGALTQVSGLEVASRTSVFAQKGRRDDVRTIGRELGVALVLEGTVRRASGRVRITAQLTGVEDGRTLWADRFDREAGDVFALEEEMARTIVDALRAGHIGALGDPTPKRYTENVAAYHLYLKGRFAWNQRTPEGVREAIDHFQRAIAADPEYALAYTGLADAHALGVDYRAAPVAEGMRLARVEAERALALDECLAEAHTSLAWVSFIHDWRWDKARHHFDRAIELNPRYATARQWHAWYLIAMGHERLALAEGRRSQELDPSSASIRRTLGWLFHFARRPEQAIVQLRQAVLINPTSSETQHVLGLAYAQAGRYDEAEVALREAGQGPGADLHALSALGRLYVARGSRAEAEHALHTLLDEVERRYVSPVDLFLLCVALGESDRAFDWMERAYEERRGRLVYLRVDPSLDAIRSDPRFEALAARVGLG